MTENFPTELELVEFLKESNAIEGVNDLVSLEQATYAWNYLINQSVLTKEVIKRTHKILMILQPLEKKYKGTFRKIPVYIGGREAMKPKDITKAINSWLDDVKISLQIPGVDGSNIRIDHIEFERIHPFVDGNGKIGRMLMNWERVKAK